jgi:hypothetical protein
VIDVSPTVIAACPLTTVAGWGAGTEVVVGAFGTVVDGDVVVVAEGVLPVGVVVAVLRITGTAVDSVAEGMVTNVVVGALTFTMSAGAVVAGAAIVVVVVEVVVVVGRTKSATRAVAELSSTVVDVEFVAVTSNFRYMSMSSSVSV